MNLIPVKAWNRSVGPCLPARWSLNIRGGEFLAGGDIKLSFHFYYMFCFSFWKTLRSDFELEIELVASSHKSFSQMSLRFYYGDRGGEYRV